MCCICDTWSHINVSFIMEAFQTKLRAFEDLYRYPKTSPNILPKSESQFLRNFMKLHPSTSWPQALLSTSPRVAGRIPSKVPIDLDVLVTQKQPYSKTITFQWFHWYSGRPWETLCDLLLLRFLLEKDSFTESQPRLSTCLRSTSQCTCEPGPAYFFKQLLNGTLLNDWWGDKMRYWQPRDTMSIRNVAWSSLREITSLWQGLR